MKEQSQLFCLHRKEWVAATPEEHVRQQLVQKMVQQLGYPPGCMALEQELRRLPHLALADRNIPDRRVDVICFSKGIHPEIDMYPLLLIECKAVPLTPKVMNQVMGYNHFVGAYFLAVANQDNIQTGWYDANQKSYRFVNYLPAYQDLLKTLRR